MRLIDLQHSTPVPPEDLDYTPRSYAILSHTWRDEEISFRDLSDPVRTAQKKGWQKIQSACQQARKDGYRYIWIDTCCIDVTSSSELSEALNSMYRWYHDAAVCYAYLDDLDFLPQVYNKDKASYQTSAHAAHVTALKSCRWFTRGWTLQELIAPRRVVFFSKPWIAIGDLSQLSEVIAEITGIDSQMLREQEVGRGELQRPRLSQYSIAQRLSWAAGRQTRRLEDRAYSLLGLLDVNMDIRYGEGTKAFVRLQEELVQRSTDQSVFAWKSDPHMTSEINASVFAPSPDFFRSAGDVVGLPSNSYRMSNQGLHLRVLCVAVAPDVLQVWLRCKLLNDPSKALVLMVSVIADSSQDEQENLMDSSSSLIKDPITCTIWPIGRIQLIDVDRMAKLAKPLDLVIQRTNDWMRRADVRPQTLFVWVRFPNDKVPVLSLASASPPPRTGSLVWMLEARSGRSAGLDAIILTLLLERTKVAEIRVVLRWKKTQCWAHVEISTTTSEDVEEKRQSLIGNVNAETMSSLAKAIEYKSDLDGSRALHATLQLLVANDETMVLIDLTHQRRMDLPFMRKARTD